MIVTVTLNTAWDVTYQVPDLVPGQTHRIDTHRGRAGGKGVNVARVLHQMGEPALVTGIVGGVTGQAVRADLDGAGVRHSFAEVAHESRRTVTVVSARTGEATVLNEAGPTAVDWPAVRDHIGTLVRDAEVVVLSGSLPPGVPPDAYGVLATLASAAGARVVLDAAGAALRAALAAAPDLVKPNAEELAGTIGHADLMAGAAALVKAGARAAVITAGAAGMTALSGQEIWHATPPRLTPVNATGAGDAAAAALALALARREPWPEALRRATGWASAAVLAPGAGELAFDRVDELTGAVQVRGVPRQPAVPVFVEHEGEPEPC